MKLTTEDTLSGTVVEINLGLNMTEVRVDLGGDEIITVMLTDQALEELDVKVGDEMEFLINTGVPAARTWH
ncbi:MAG: TOBE domain-containing protein [Deltaproteobacteria bacterium]|nr:TOBE domain-containing protein [Deltaproteobacteria bacterium]